MKAKAWIYLTDRSTGEDKNLLVDIPSGKEQDVELLISKLISENDVSGWEWDAEDLPA